MDAERSEASPGAVLFELDQKVSLPHRLSRLTVDALNLGGRKNHDHRS